MSLETLFYLLPIISVGMTVLLLMLSIAFRRCNLVVFGLSLIGLFVAFFLTFNDIAKEIYVTDLFVIDNLGVFGIRLVLLITFAVIIFAFGYLKKRHEEKEEFYILLLISCLGALCVVVSNHFISFFLGLEILTIPLYALIAYFHRSIKGLEAAIKYIILAGASAAFLLFGIVLLYGQFGSMRFDILAENWASMWNLGRLILLLGLTFIAVGVCFKLSAVPFHMWAPDVYEGASMPVTAYLATVSKGALLILLLRFSMQLHLETIAQWQWTLSVIAVLSMFFGNCLALLQNNIKRLLAYSSIAHVGYMLVALLSGHALGISAILFYLVAYITAVLLIFGVLTEFEDEQEQLITIDSMRGLFYTNPGLSLCLTFAFFSLVGVPLTAGFMGKYWILLAGVHQAKWNLLFCLVVSAAIGFYAYLKVIIALFQTQKTSNFPLTITTKKSTGAVLVILLLVSFMLGIMPDSVTDMIQVFNGAL